MREILAKLLFPSIFNEKQEWKETALTYLSILKALESDCKTLSLEVDKLQLKVKKLSQKPSMELTEQSMDSYLQTKGFKQVKNIAYGDKRDGVGIFLNQMITPNAYEVQKIKNRFIKTKDRYKRIESLGSFLAKHTTWVDEKKLYKKDIYRYPEETLTLYKDSCDCEDVSNVMASFEPKFMGVCYGFLSPNSSTRFGHAFPVFLYNDKLYIVETTTNNVEITPFEDKRYETYYIITKENTYQLKGGVAFGRIISDGN